jgi:hypothetical protein
MRWLPTVLLLLCACSPDVAEPSAEQLLYSGEGRDRLCIAGPRGGLIVYGKENANCSIRGQVSRAGEHLLVLIPAGDADCRIDLVEQSGGIRVGKKAEACNYYCGPGADYSGKVLTTNKAATPAVDFAGDPLC